MLSARLWQRLGIGGLELQINSLGTAQARVHYREALVKHLCAHATALDDDSRRRLETNPLRVLDSKNADMQAVIASAPSLKDYLDAESLAHFETLCTLLDNAGIAYRVNPRLVRGLDYYTRTVFEWVTTELGSQGTICAGGRYDGLVEQLGGQATPAAGFALGIERLAELAALQQVKGVNVAPQVYIAPQAEGEVLASAMRLAEQLRDAGIRVELHCGPGSLKSQLKRAARSGAQYVLLADSAGQVNVKNLRAEAPPHTVAFADVAAFLHASLEKEAHDFIIVL